MAGTAQYTKREILWVLKKITEEKIKCPKFMNKLFKRNFGRPLAANQFRYLKNKYGRDPDFNACSVTRRAVLRLKEEPIELDLLTTPTNQDAPMRNGHEERGPDGANLNKTDTDGNAEPQSSGGSNPVAEATNSTTAGLATNHHHDHHHGHYHAAPGSSHEHYSLPQPQQMDSLMHFDPTLYRAHRRVQMRKPREEQERRQAMHRAQMEQAAHMQAAWQQAQLQAFWQQPQMQIPMGQYPMNTQFFPFCDPTVDSNQQPQFDLPTDQAFQYTDPLAFMDGQLPNNYNIYPRAPGPHSHEHGYPQAGYSQQTWYEAPEVQGTSCLAQAAQEVVVTAPPEPWVVLEQAVAEPAAVETVEPQAEESLAVANEESSSGGEFTPSSSEEGNTFVGYMRSTENESELEQLMLLRDAVHCSDVSLSTGVSNGTEFAPTEDAFIVPEETTAFGMDNFFDMAEFLNLDSSHFQ